MSEQKTLIGEQTADQIEALKANHGKIIAITVSDGDDEHICYCKRPSFETMSAMAKLGKTDEVQAARTLLDNCWIAGSTEIRKDAILSLTVSNQLGSLIAGVKASLKNA